MIYTVQALQPLVAAGGRLFAAVYYDTEKNISAHAAAAGWTVTRVWQSEFRNSDLILIERRPNAAPVD